ncbi:MAG: S41 family peptidase [Marinagarivorans sp.]|nr:S41 family peptidase [Marinagarivorans sp.]
MPTIRYWLLLTAALIYSSHTYAEQKGAEAKAATTKAAEQAAKIKLEPTPAAANAEVQRALPLEDLRIFTQIYEQIRKNYVDEIDDKTLLEYAIRGMLDKLDPHSAYLDKSSFNDLQVHTTGEFGGIGIEVSMEDGFLKVVSPIDDTPASKAGIESGDIIVKLNDTFVKGLALDEAIELMRGPKDTEITITISRQDVSEPFDVVIVRDIIKVRSIRHEIVNDHYGYVRIAQFQTRTGPDMINAINEMRAQTELEGLVLDLRNNPGGVLQASVTVAGAFLDGDKVVYTEGRTEAMNEAFFAEAGDITNGLPLVVLINDGSASASEIVAGALQDHKRAVILGTRSFGKGSVQTVQPISQDKAIKLTTARYYTPNGRSIQAQGIEPDIPVERVRVTAIKGQRSVSEAELSGHINNNSGKEIDRKTRNAEQDRTEQSLQNQDNQLYEAINLLKGLSIFNHLKAETSPAQ